MAVPDFVRPQVESQGEGRLAARQWQWQRQLKVITSMLYCLGETYVHISPLPWLSPICLESLDKMWRTPFFRT